MHLDILTFEKIWIHIFLRIHLSVDGLTTQINDLIINAFLTQKLNIEEKVYKLHSMIQSELMTSAHYTSFVCQSNLNGLDAIIQKWIMTDGHVELKMFTLSFSGNIYKLYLIANKYIIHIFIYSIHKKNKDILSPYKLFVTR